MSFISKGRKWFKNYPARAPKKGLKMADSQVVLIWVLNVLPEV
jgi:hypothetical protein